VIPDGAQGPDVIVGRNWLDSSTVTYRKVGNDLIIEKVSSVNELVEPSVMTLGNEFDVLYVVNEDDVDTPLPLVLDDFKFVAEDASSVEREELMNLVNEYRGCFGKGLSELGCTPLMTMDTNEVPGSRPVVCRPYKTSAEDRKEIAVIVGEWKKCGIVEETQSPYASPVLLVKQSGGKHRLCVDYRRLNKQTLQTSDTIFLCPIWVNNLSH